jgi:hypothetical protein
MSFVSRFLRIAAFIVIAGLIGGAQTADTASTNHAEFSHSTVESTPLFPLGDMIPQSANVVASSDVDDDQPEDRAQIHAAKAWPRLKEMPVSGKDLATRVQSFLRPSPTGPPAT